MPISIGGSSGKMARKPKSLYQIILDLQKTLGLYSYGSTKSFKESWSRRIVKYVEANYVSKDKMLTKLKDFEILDHREEWKKRRLYQGPNPINEYLLNQDIGFRRALEWVLGIEKLNKR